MSDRKVRQYKENFHEELKSLLRKYQVDICIDDEGDGCASYIVAEFDFHEELGIIDNINYGSGIYQ